VSQDVSEGVAPLAAALQPAVAAVGGRVDVLINCAGTSVSGAFDALPEAAFEEMYQVRPPSPPPSLPPSLPAVGGRVDVLLNCANINLFIYLFVHLFKYYYLFIYLFNE
jgi:hypothetical protein